MPSAKHLVRHIRRFTMEEERDQHANVIHERRGRLKRRQLSRDSNQLLAGPDGGHLVARHWLGVAPCGNDTLQRLRATDIARLSQPSVESSGIDDSAESEMWRPEQSDC